MKARTQDTYNGALAIVESQMQYDKPMQAEFVHELFEAMRIAFAQGLNGNVAPDVITALKATGKPFAMSTANLIENAYTNGLKARG